MAAVAECKYRNISLYKESYVSFTQVLNEYLLTEYQYWIQYVDCCNTVRRFRIDNQIGWETGGDPTIYVYSSPGLPALFPPFIFVKRISDGVEIILPTWSSPDDGWVYIEDGANYIPDCSEITTSTTTATPTTTKNPLGIVFHSCCDDNATYSVGLYPSLPRVICLRDPIHSVYILGSGTSSTFLPSASYSEFFLNEEVTNPGPSCSCNCATQSIACSRIKVKSTEAGTFRYIECESGLVLEQDLTPSNFQTVERPTLISVPQNCTQSITNTTASVNLLRSIGTIVPTNPTTNPLLITYVGPFGNLMSNSYYLVPVSGTYYVTSLIVGNITTTGSNATNSVTARLMKDSGGVTSSLDSSSYQIVYSGSANYNYTFSLPLGGKTYSLLTNDKLFVDISKSAPTVRAQYNSISCDIYSGLSVFVTSSVSNTQRMNRPHWAWYPPNFNPFRITLNHPTSQPRWSGSTFSVPVTTGYTFSWLIEGTFSLTYDNIKTFALGFGLMKSIDSVANQVFSTLVYDNLPNYNPPGPAETIVRAFTFSTSPSIVYRGILNQGDILSLEMRAWVAAVHNQTLPIRATFSISFKNGSSFNISQEPWWANSRNQTYFEVSGGPTHADDALNYDFEFCARTPLQNQPPLQRISGSYTYSVCSTPGSIYYSACSPALTYECGTYTREFVEISGTQCLWPTTTSTTTSDVIVYTTTAGSG